MRMFVERPEENSMPPEGDSQSAELLCQKCQARLKTDHLNGEWVSSAFDWLATCPKCHTEHLAHAYPALLRPAEKASAAEILEADEASCFYHETSRAEKSCSICGRFVCGLCHIKMGGRDLCPGCVGNRDLRKRHISTANNRRTDYGRLILSLAYIPIFLFFAAFALLPIAIYLTFRSRNRPEALLKRKQPRLAIGLVLLLLEFMLALFIIFQ